MRIHFGCLFSFHIPVTYTNMTPLLGQESRSGPENGLRLLFGWFGRVGEGASLGSFRSAIVHSGVDPIISVQDALKVIRLDLEFVTGFVVALHRYHCFFASRVFFRISIPHAHAHTHTCCRTSSLQLQSHLVLPMLRRIAVSRRQVGRYKRSAPPFFVFLVFNSRCFL